MARSFKYVSAFLVPVGQWDEQYYVVCPNCEYGYELSNRAVAADVASLDEATWPETLFDVEAAAGRGIHPVWGWAAVAVAGFAVVFAAVSILRNEGNGARSSNALDRPAIEGPAATPSAPTTSEPLPASTAATAAPVAVTLAPTTTISAPTAEEIAIGFFQEGVSAFEDGDLDTALERFGDAIDADPSFAPAYFSRGTILYFDLGRTEEARADFDASIAVDPDFAPGYYGLGILQYEAGDEEAAISSLRSFLQLADSQDEFTASAREILDFLGA